jgi:hypothetical protein
VVDEGDSEQKEVHHSSILDARLSRAEVQVHLWVSEDCADGVSDRAERARRGNDPDEFNQTRDGLVIYRDQASAKFGSRIFFSDGQRKSTAIEMDADASTFSLKRPWFDELSEERSIEVPYRSNRLVIFSSQLFYRRGTRDMISDQADGKASGKKTAAFDRRRQQPDAKSPGDGIIFLFGEFTFSDGDRMLARDVDSS